MKDTYKLRVAGLERELPLCSISPDLKIAAFVILGDVELTTACAAELIKKIPQHDIMITAEAKGIPLIHEMARQMNASHYLVARKSQKLYMTEPISVEVQSITTARKQILYIDKKATQLMKNKRVLIIDDVISTGESILAVEKLVKMSGGTVVGKASILAEGDAKFRNDILFLEYLPLFNAEGEPLG